MSIVAKRLDGSRCHLYMEVGLVPSHIVLDGDLAPLKGAQPPTPNFRPMSIVAKRSPISDAAEQLLCYLKSKNKHVSGNCTSLVSILESC